MSRPSIRSSAGAADADTQERPVTQTPQVPEVQQADPELIGVRNFRAVSGLPAADGRRLRPDVLYRSGHLARATAEDAAFLASLGLHTVFDFRNKADVALDGPDVALDGVRHVSIPLTDPADGAEFWRLVRDGSVAQLRELLGDGGAAARMTGTYRVIVKSRTAEHSRVLHALAEDSVPALMHCAAGKDRAGLAVAVTLLALGVDRDAIEADYLESAAPHRRYRYRRSGDVPDGMTAEVTELLSPLFDARAEYLEAAFTAIEEQWGTVDAYLTDGLEFGPADRERLRERMLEG